jgi:hypothetical protein
MHFDIAVAGSMVPPARQRAGGRPRIKGLEAGHGSAGIAEYPWGAGAGQAVLAR